MPRAGTTFSGTRSGNDPPGWAGAPAQRHEMLEWLDHGPGIEHRDDQNHGEDDPLHNAGSSSLGIPHVILTSRVPPWHRTASPLPRWRRGPTRARLDRPWPTCQRRHPALHALVARNVAQCRSANLTILDKLEVVHGRIGDRRLAFSTRPWRSADTSSTAMAVAISTAAAPTTANELRRPWHANVRANVATRRATTGIPARFARKTRPRRVSKPGDQRLPAPGDPAEEGVSTPRMPTTVSAFRKSGSARAFAMTRHGALMMRFSMRKYFPAARCCVQRAC